MGFSFKVTTRIEPKSSRNLDPDSSPGFGADPGPQRPAQSRNSGVRLLAGFALLAATLFLLWINVGFARYALTGLFWTQIDGTVLDSSVHSSWPTVQFLTPDGAAHTFSEDYIILCGRRSLCIARNFTAGQVVPVVYDSTNPRFAYIRDWALYSNVLTWFFEAAIGLFFASMIALLLVKKPLNFSVRLGTRTDPGEPLA
jgi:hypothetical protein